MIRNMKILLATLVVALSLVPLALADVSPAVQPYVAAANTAIAASPVAYVGANWGPIPLYRVDLTGVGLNSTIDVAANSPAEARAAVVDLVAEMFWEAAGRPAAVVQVVPPPQDPTPAVPEIVTPATTTPAVVQTVNTQGDSTPSIVLPASGTFNPLLAATVSKAVGRTVTIDAKTTCFVSGKQSPCVKLYGFLQHSKRHVTVASRPNLVAKKIIVS